MLVDKGGRRMEKNKLIINKKALRGDDGYKVFPCG